MNSPGKCSIGAASAAWVNARLSGNRTLPVDCPYKVNVVNQFINFAADLFGPKSTNSQYGPGGVLGPIISLLDNTSVMPSVGAYWSQDPAVSTGLVMIFSSGSYAAGHYPAGGPGPWSNDSGRVQVFGATTGIALAFVQLSGRATVAPGYLVVPSEVVAMVATPFRAVTAVDTSSFNFLWQVDGVSVSSPNDADFASTWSLAGPHQVRVLATHAGGTDTIATSVMAKLNIALFGSSVVTTGCPVEYMATRRGSGRWEREHVQHHCDLVRFADSHRGRHG